MFTEHVAEVWPDARIRDWFADARGPVRRMQVSHHVEDGLVVFSLWEGDRCRATFRMPVRDATRLVHDLVDVVASSPVEPDRRLPTATRLSARARLARFWRSLMRRASGERAAQVVHLHERRH